MEKTKTYLAKRILCFLLVGCLTSASVFFSYSNTLTVKADDSIIIDIERTAVTVAGIIAGVLFPESITAVLIFEALAQGGIDIQEHLIDNGDGTYTIKAELIQAVLDSVQQLEEYSFDDDRVSEILSGNNYIYHGNFYSEIVSYTGTTTNTATRQSVYELSGSVNYPIAGFTGTLVDGLGTEHYFLFFCNNTPSGSGYIKLDGSYITYVDGVLETSKTDSFIQFNMCKSTCSHLTCIQTYNFDVPIFATEEEAREFTNNGVGYENALNYNQTYFEYGSKYTGTYSGGDITVSESILNGISAKVDSLNQTSKSTDEKLEELLEYITEESEDEEPETGGTDDDEEIEGSTWLERIFNVLKKIYGKIKSIRRWVIADTVIDGIDLVTELFDGLGGLIKDLIKTPLEAFAEIMTDIEQIGNALSSKFPFCIPWDIAFLLGLLSAEPKTPEFKLPLQIETYGIDEEIVLSLEDFEIVSKISRTFLTLIFCHGLLNLTFKIVDMKEKENRNT